MTDSGPSGLQDDIEGEPLVEEDDPTELEEYGFWSAADGDGDGDEGLDWGGVQLADGLELVPGYPKCPPPTKWRVVRQRVVNGKLTIVSTAVSAKVAPVTHTFTTTRSLTFGASITRGVKASLKILEAEASVTLSASVTIERGETVSYTIPKGRIMALYGGCGFVERTLQRTVYGSAMCNRVVQECTVLSPRMALLEVRSV